MLKKLRYITEYILIWILYAVFKTLPWRMASDLGGFLARFIGPRLAVSRKALRHIKLAFPEKTDHDAKTIMTGMWDNLGRVFAEYPHLQRISSEAVICHDLSVIEALRDHPRAAIFCGTHMANWELQTAFFAQKGVPIHSVYRRPNNPYVAKLLASMREMPNTDHFEKSKSGMMQLVKKLRSGGCIGLLIDQKFNAGPESLFFGHTVRSSRAFVDLSQKFDCPLYFGRIKRMDKTKFELIITNEIPTSHPNGSKKTQIELLDEYHRYLEEWITDTPEQWLWLHRRWKNV